MPGVSEPLIAFPAKQVEENLLNAFAQVVLDQIQVSAGGISDASLLSAFPGIDSLVAVEVLCVLDEVLQIRLTECVVRPGGYDTVEEAVAHITAGAKRAWDKKHKHD